MRRLLGLPKLFKRFDYAAKGWLFPTDSAGIEVPLAVGDDDQVLTADSAADGGMSWQDPTGGAGLVDADYGDVTVTGSGTVMTIDNDVVTDAKLRNGGACSVIGRSANSSGDPADIAAASNDQLLVRRSNVLGFGALVAGDIPDVSATYIPKSLVDAKGDLLVGTADNTVARKAAGTNGYYLSADSTQSDGLLYVVPGVGAVVNVTFKLRGTLVDTSYVDLIVKGYRFTILSWAIYEATGSASVVVDIQQADLSGTPSFTTKVGGGGNKPTLSTARVSEAAVSSWTSTDVNATSTTRILRAVISGTPTAVSDLTVTLAVQRTG
jgi:hypothetical protein